MKALTLTQPWATLVAIGAKKIETRSWGTGYRGQLAIHAAKGFKPEDENLMRVEPFRSALAAAGYHRWGQLPRGKVLAICELDRVIKITGPVTLTTNERAFGDFELGRFMWFLRGARQLAGGPVEAIGKQGIWEWSTAPLVEYLPEALERV